MAPASPFTTRMFSRRRSRLASGGMTLVEVVVAAGVLAVAGFGGVSTLVLLNRYAANLRNMTMARALCQERIEQALTQSFRPGAIKAVVPSAPSADPSSTGPRAILGTLANYTNGAFNAGANYQTSTETIPIFMKQESTAGSADSTVTYTRVSTVSPAGINAVASNGGATTTSLNMIQFTVTVSWVYRGNTYSTFMTALRSPD